MAFELGFQLNPERTATDWWFVFCGNKMMVRTAANAASIPSYSEVLRAAQEFSRIHYLGRLNGVPCYTAEIHESHTIGDGMVFQELRPLLGLLGEELFSLAARAVQILHWDRTHQFCGRCGSRTELKQSERARECPQCGLVNYPAMAPAIIVAVTKGDEILLARSHRFHVELYSVLAGFVEPGETLEQCVRREVREEVGIEVENITYVASQPWPFPNTLMMGFTAEYAGGEVSVDHVEITDAGWFSAGKLPMIPLKGSIARRLIDWFVEKSG